jgi:replicative DNA helicase
VSVERYVVSALVEGGANALRTLYANGVSKETFYLYADEFEWVERRIGKRKPVNRRTFTEIFPDFEWLRSTDELADLAIELKEEAALAEWNQIASTVSEQATKDNILDLLLEVRERITATTRKHAPVSDVDLDDWRPVIEQMQQGMLLAQQGQSVGILTGIDYIDHFIGGLMPGQFMQVNGRTGEGKSMFVVLLAWPARKTGNNVGIFSPELNDHEVRCRYHTIASADKEVQKVVGLERSFRNTHLMRRRDFNLKSYQRFCEYVDSLPGRMHMLAGAGMKEQMSVAYIESKIEEHELDIVFVDPIYLLKPVRTTREGNTWQETAWTAEALHRVGETYNIPIVFTNQSHLDGNKGDAPTLDKSFGTKTMPHLADYVLSVMHLSEENLLKVRSNKSRFGDSFQFRARFFPNTGFFQVETPLVTKGKTAASEEEVDQGEYVANAPRKGK